MVTIFFHTHATTFDDEVGWASGHNDVKLSPAGVEEAKHLGKPYKGKNIDIVFCSDLLRSYYTAEIAFSKRLPVIKDERLREIDYGDSTLKPKQEVKALRLEYISDPYPGGESYTQILSRTKSFLKDLLRDYNGKQVVIVGHDGTRVALDYWLNDESLENALTNMKKVSSGIAYQLVELWPLRIDSQPLD